jgi:polysaccharide biosynthesis transport protein
MDEYRSRSRGDALLPALEATPANSLDIKQCIEVLLRRRWWVVGTIVLVTSIIGAFVYLVAPRYTAELTAVFEPRGREVFNLEASLAGLPQDEASLLNRVEIFRSRSLADRVIKNLQLQNDPEFNEKLRPNGRIYAWFSSIVAYLFGDDAFLLQPATPIGEKGENIAGQRIVDNLLRRLEVQPIGRSRSVMVRFTAEDPVTAAKVANALGEQFVVAHLEDKLENARRATNWLATHVERLREDVQKAEAKAEAYRRQHNLLQGERATLVAQQISDLNTKLIDANINTRAAETNLAQARKLAFSRAGSAVGTHPKIS